MDTKKPTHTHTSHQLHYTHLSLVSVCKTTLPASSSSSSAMVALESFASRLPWSEAIQSQWSALVLIWFLSPDGREKKHLPVSSACFCPLIVCFIFLWMMYNWILTCHFEYDLYQPVQYSLHVMYISYISALVPHQADLKSCSVAFRWYSCGENSNCYLVAIWTHSMVSNFRWFIPQQLASTTLVRACRCFMFRFRVNLRDRLMCQANHRDDVMKISYDKKLSFQTQLERSSTVCVYLCGWIVLKSTHESCFREHGTYDLKFWTLLLEPHNPTVHNVKFNHVGSVIVVCTIITTTAWKCFFSATLEKKNKPQPSGPLLSLIEHSTSKAHYLWHCNYFT